MNGKIFSFQKKINSKIIERYSRQIVLKDVGILGQNLIIKSKVLIVGAGFCGVYLLDQLRKKNFKAQIYEGGADLGGVWHWNCYPGARVDSSCWIYQLSDEELWSDWQWTELYPGYKEVRAYFKHLDKKLDLSRDVRFNTWVREANFNEDRHEWEIKAKRNDGSNVVVCMKHFIERLFCISTYDIIIPKLKDNPKNN